MVVESMLDLATDVLVLPAQFKALCAAPDVYPLPTGLSSLDFFGELFIGNYDGKLKLIESSHRDFTVMRHHDKSRRDGSWRVEQATRETGYNSWSARLDDVTYTFEGQSCGITTNDGREKLTVSFKPSATSFCITRFVLE